MPMRIDMMNIVTPEMVARENGTAGVSRLWVENKDRDLSERGAGVGVGKQRKMCSTGYVRTYLSRC